MQTNPVCFSLGAAMRTTILAIAAALVLALPVSSYARGFGGGGYACKTTAECEERKAAQEKRAAEWKAEQAEQNAKAEAEEKAEQAKVKQATASGLEQVKRLVAGEREINSWLRKNPAVTIVRVVPSGGAVLIFYRNSK